MSRSTYEASRLGEALGLNAEAAGSFCNRLPSGSVFRPEGSPRFHVDRSAALAALGASDQEARVLDRLVEATRQRGEPGDYVGEVAAVSTLEQRAEARQNVATFRKGGPRVQAPAGREAEIEEARAAARRVNARCR